MSTCSSSSSDSCGGDCQRMSIQSNGRAGRARAAQRQQITPAQSSAARMADIEGIGTAGILPGVEPG